VGSLRLRSGPFWKLLQNSTLPILLVKSARPYRHLIVLAAINPTHAFSTGASTCSLPGPLAIFARCPWSRPARVIGAQVMLEATNATVVGILGAAFHNFRFDQPDLLWHQTLLPR
jgi:hypothetical protein